MKLPDPFLSQTRNGIATIQESIDTFKRETNNTNLRVEVQDPTTSIDAPRNTQILDFPHDRPKYYMSFAFEEYSRPTQFEGLTNKGLVDYITLPMPGNLIDNNEFSYSTGAGSFLADAIGRTVLHQNEEYRQGGLRGMLDNISSTSGMKDLIAQAGGDITGFATRTVYDLAKGIDSYIDRGLTKGLLQTLGLAENQFNTVGFEGPNFKRHQFVWQLSPKSKEESETVNQITNTFKKAAHPELLVAAAGGFYKYPMIVWPKFNPDSTREFMYNFKPCVIESISMNYTPSRPPAFYGASDAPIDVVLAINLLEIELWRKGNGGSILNGEMPTVKTGDFQDVATPPGRESNQAREID